MRYTLFALSSLITGLHALTITYPTSGSDIDPSKPITVRWTSSSSDPTTVNLVLTSPANSVYNTEGGVGVVASNVPVSSGSYTIPANTIAAYGTGFIITANRPSGDNVASSGAFLLGYGAPANNQVVTGANGQLSLVPAQTSLSSLVFDTSGVTGSMTAIGLSGSSAGASATATHSPSSMVLTTGAVTGSMTIQTSVRSSSGSASASETSSGASASATAKNSAQSRVGLGQGVMGVAGLLAGLVAFVA